MLFFFFFEVERIFLDSGRRGKKNFTYSFFFFFFSLSLFLVAGLSSTARFHRDSAPVTHGLSLSLSLPRCVSSLPP